MWSCSQYLFLVCHSFDSFISDLIFPGPFSAEEDALIVQRVEEVGLSMGAASKCPFNLFFTYIAQREKQFNCFVTPFSSSRGTLLLSLLFKLFFVFANPGTGRVVEPVDPSDPAHTQTSSAAFPAGFWEHLSAETNRPPEILRTRVKTLRARGSNVL